jgi:hypothetical protein
VRGAFERIRALAISMSTTTIPMWMPAQSGNPPGRPIGARGRFVSVSLTAQLPGHLEPGDWALLVEVIGAVRQAVPDAGDVLAVTYI